VYLKIKTCHIETKLLEITINQRNKLETTEITEEEIVKAIDEFKPNKSPGIDNITSTYALETKEILAKPLRLLFSKSIQLS